MKKGIMLMLAGAGTVLAYQQYKNGNIKRTIDKAKHQINNKLENMK